MTHQEFANTLNETEQKEILDTLTHIEEQRLRTSKYETKDLDVLFRYWVKLYPNEKVKMSMGCGGCRKAVHKFFFNISKYFKNKTN